MVPWAAEKPRTCQDVKNAASQLFSEDNSNFSEEGFEKTLTWVTVGRQRDKAWGDSLLSIDTSSAFSDSDGWGVYLEQRLETTLGPKERTSTSTAAGAAGGGQVELIPYLKTHLVTPPKSKEKKKKKKRDRADSPERGKKMSKSLKAKVTAWGHGHIPPLWKKLQGSGNVGD